MSIGLMQKVAEVAPDKYAFFLKTSSEVRGSPFRDEIVGEISSLAKKASQPGLLSRMGSSFGSAAAGIGAAAAASVAYSLAGDMYDALKRGITKSRNYRSMLQEHPDLRELPVQDVQRAFSTLHRFNPEFAGDPTVAAQFVRQNATLQEPNIKGLTELVGARKNLHEVKKLPIPGRVPWETAQEKKHRQLQMQSIEQQLLQRGEQHPLQIEQLKQQIEQAPEEHKRRGESHKMQSQMHTSQMHPNKALLDQLRVRQMEDQIAQSSAAGAISAPNLTARQRKLLGLP